MPHKQIEPDYLIQYDSYNGRSFETIYLVLKEYSDSLFPDSPSSEIYSTLLPYRFKLSYDFNTNITLLSLLVLELWPYPIWHCDYRKIVPPLWRNGNSIGKT